MFKLWLYIALNYIILEKLFKSEEPQNMYLSAHLIDFFIGIKFEVYEYF